MDSLKEKSKEIDKSIDENKYELEKKSKECELQKLKTSELANEQTNIRTKIQRADNLINQYNSDNRDNANTNKVNISMKIKN